MGSVGTDSAASASRSRMATPAVTLPPDVVAVASSSLAATPWC